MLNNTTIDDAGGGGGGGDSLEAYYDNWPKVVFEFIVVSIFHSFLHYLDG